jgi:membrane protease YdiL (CAAX protease family)
VHAAPPPQLGRGRLVGWLIFVLALAGLNYASRLAGAETPDDLAYRYSSSVAGVIQYGIMVGILLLIARGVPLREAFALRPPPSWPRALGLVVLSLFTIFLVAVVYGLVVSALGDWDPSEEQGLIPDDWDSSRAGAFAAFFFLVTFVAPAVEELTYRGVGFTLLAPFGTVVAIVGTGVLFGAAHGLLIALPVLAVFGIVVGWLRWKTDSLYPPVILHTVFNGSQLLIAVAA